MTEFQTFKASLLEIRLTKKADTISHIEVKLTKKQRKAFNRNARICWMYVHNKENTCDLAKAYETTRQRIHQILRYYEIKTRTRMEAGKLQRQLLTQYEKNHIWRNRFNMGLIEMEDFLGVGKSILERFFGSMGGKPNCHKSKIETIREIIRLGNLGHKPYALSKQFRVSNASVYYYLEHQHQYQEKTLEEVEKASGH